MPPLGRSRHLTQRRVFLPVFRSQSLKNSVIVTESPETYLVEGCMHRTFNIYPERRLCVVRFIGAIDYEDFVQWASDAMKEPLFSRDYDGVVDIRRAVFKHMRPEKARELATFMIDNEFTNGKWVSLVTKPMESA